MDKKILCWLLTFTMVFSMFGGVGQVAFGESFTDVDNHWAKTDIEEWTEKDLISGYGDGTFKPNDNITRAEFITLVNNVINIQIEEEISFSDVEESDWYYKDLKRAIYGEYITGYEDNTFRANEKITRQEVAVILQNLAQLEATDEDSLGRFTDTEDTPDWSRASLMLAVQRGYLSGYEDNTLKASDYITRAESVKVLNNLFGTIYNESGTYGPSVDEDVLQVTGNVTVSAEDVTLQNIIIDGDLYLAEGIGEGDVTLDNITVTGETIVKGGGDNSIIIKNSSLANLLIIKKDGKIRIIAQGNTTINKTYLYSSARLQVERLNSNSFGDVEVIRVTPGESLEFEGSFDKIDVKAPADIEITGNSKIEELNIHKDLENVNILVSADSRVEKLYVDSEIEVVNKGIILEALGDFAKDSNYDVKLPVNLQPRRDSRTSSSTEPSTPSVSKYSLTLNVAPTGAGTTRGAGSYEEGTKITITATANGGYEFVEWKDGENQITTSSALSYTTTSENKTFTAYFESTGEPNYSLDLVVTPTGSGTTSGSGNYEEGTEVTITATANDGYEFVEWKDGENQITTSSALSYTTTSENKTFTAYFESTGEFAGGSGTESNPFQVATAEQLNNVRNYLDKHFIQVEDIDLTDKEWEPIGEFSSGGQFVGSYDGNNKTINHLTIVPDASDQYVGLFGVIGYDWEAEIYAQLSNINLENVIIRGTELHSVGSLVGRADNNTTIDNCSAFGEIIALDQRGYAIGGLVGVNYATLSNSEASVKIYVSPTGTGNKAGGLAGHNGGHINNSFATGDVTGNEYVGGLLGWHSNNPLTNSYSTGSVTGDESVGGLIGLAWGITERCFSSGNVNGNTYVGGLIGSLPGYVRNVYASGSVTGGNTVGGLVGFYSGGGSPAEITNAYAYGKVSGSAYTGGLVGAIWESSPSAPITSSYWDTETTGRLNSVGGTGYVTSAMIKEINSVPIYVDWDFANIWTMKEGQSYPYFRWQNDQNIPYPPSPFDGGSGTLLNPYQVANAQQLDVVRNYLDKHFIQTANIDLDLDPWNTGKGWVPISGFEGSYDGNEKTISNIMINRPTENNVGLFDTLLSTVLIQDLALVNANISGNTRVGTVAGEIDGGTLRNISASGTVSAESTYVGGLVGNLQGGLVEQCNSTVDVSGFEWVGGLVGSSPNATIRKSSASGIVNGTGRYVGGLLGTGTNATISESYATGDVTGNISFVGGLIGSFEGVLEDSYATGEVRGPVWVGGLVGDFSTGTIKTSYASGSVIGIEPGTRNAIGGLVGNSQLDTLIEDSYATGSVTGNKFIGGLIGTNNGNINNAYAIGQVSGSQDTGGLVGANRDGVLINNSFWNKDTTNQTISSGSDSANGKTTDEMIQQITFFGWDFKDIWNIKEGTYPYFQWQTESTIPYPPSPFAGGKGTAEDPFQVATAEQLDQVRNYLDKQFIQTANIDLDKAPYNEGNGWEPIGNTLKTFSGSYNGNEYTISNLYINRPSGIYIGLFGYNSGIISSCSVIGIVNGNQQTGILVGINNGIINDSNVKGEVSGTFGVGGFVGSNRDFGIITNSNSEVKVTSSADNVGGFAGHNYVGKIDKCYSTGDVKGIKQVGGLVGRNEGDINESFSSGNVTADTINSDTHSGGLVGYNSGNIKNCYSLGNVVGYRFVGGLVGYNTTSNGKISNSYSTGSVTGTAGTGGLLGFNKGTVTLSYWNTETSNQDTSAGGTGYSTSYMTNSSNFSDWNFDTIWNIIENITYPYLIDNEQDPLPQPIG
ncbi:GLUG motif-containing protein [Gudongella sp. DL1XJH-153]|uniref:GLUG motif-containing protein n=1 Tax=Gudongella sp. DL1XJH-153 TaxID=3409804 RepID=UPI003BB64713